MSCYFPITNQQIECSYLLYRMLFLSYRHTLLYSCRSSFLPQYPVERAIHRIPVKIKIYERKKNRASRRMFLPFFYDFCLRLRLGQWFIRPSRLFLARATPPFLFSSPFVKRLCTRDIIFDRRCFLNLSVFALITGVSDQTRHTQWFERCIKSEKKIYFQIYKKIIVPM